MNYSAQVLWRMGYFNNKNVNGLRVKPIAHLRSGPGSVAACQWLAEQRLSEKAELTWQEIFFWTRTGRKINICSLNCFQCAHSFSSLERAFGCYFSRWSAHDKNYRGVTSVRWPAGKRRDKRGQRNIGRPVRVYEKGPNTKNESDYWLSYLKYRTKQGIPQRWPMNFKLDY